MNETIILPDSIKRSETPALPLSGVSSCATSEVYLMDCVEGLRHYPDNYFDLAVVDPPYGSNNIQGGYTSGKGGGVAKQKKYNQKLWTQKAPGQEYFAELFRVSKNQIIWGANHFIEMMPINSSGWIFWDKRNGEVSFSDGELAWTSFDKALRKFEYMWSGMLQQNMKNKEQRIHPTQKPIALYEWILSKYASDGDLILDTHVGSGSSRIAANKAGLDFVGFEIDNEYFESQEKRWREFVGQTRLF